MSPSGTIYRGGRLLSGTSEEQVRHATADGFELEHVLTPGGRVLSRKLVSAGA
ncbi:hypothetical protein Bequi_13335 [Brachybacterium sp. JHP9]|uniref:Uncharacterized protein n=1 Tax=Brachybacterium equifaecis TaxID=2910770 RepID=A0ABT0R334_9MICO|nr:hypothetical protein [Brachybacterium equifaecis]MCL6424348.1 hypothetical protein [Brachybacterium equifaecis]